jgi:hypothetical protein
MTTYTSMHLAAFSLSGSASAIGDAETVTVLLVAFIAGASPSRSTFHHGRCSRLQATVANRTFSQRPQDVCAIRKHGASCAYPRTYCGLTAAANPERERTVIWSLNSK